MPGPRSAFVQLVSTGDAHVVTEYRPNPERRYRTAEKERRQNLDYYYRNRERVLERMRKKREAARADRPWKTEDLL